MTVFAQKPKKSNNPAQTKSPPAKIIKTADAPIGKEAEEFEKAIARTVPADRIAALQRFTQNFPNSAAAIRAAELIVSARAELADTKLRSGEAQSGAELFKLAVRDAPTPISDKLFTEIILQIPTNLFFRGERAAALETAALIENKVAANAKQTLGLATFYLGIENAAEAKRLAVKAVAIEPNLPAAYQTLGLASRLDFRLEEAADAYAKALELDKNSVVSKRSLAEMKRALGKSDEAVRLYREILTINDTDAAARTGLILSLFDAGSASEAEAQMARSLEANANNLSLLVGAAYQYAARGNGEKAVEFANKAIALEPRYTWAHIALARGFMLKDQPLEAERVLLAARQYGNFPTLDYELAAVRLKAGFFREAAKALENSFSVKDGIIRTKLGGRVPIQAADFTELLAAERRASIFEPVAADNASDAEKLKLLLDFTQKLAADQPSDTETSAAAEEFARGDDKMRLHRHLYAANRLLEKRIAAGKALELAKAAVGEVSKALDVPSPAAAVLAEELYESRTIAITRNQLIIVPDIARDTLSKILRGRIEETTGRALLQQEKPEEAVVRFKRALSVLPEKSAWWRDSMWRLGSALQSGKKDQEALDAYIKSYASGAPDAAKRIVIESLYRQVNGTLEGLNEKIGAKPSPEATALTQTDQSKASNETNGTEEAEPKSGEPQTEPLKNVQPSESFEENAALPAESTNQSETNSNGKSQLTRELENPLPVNETDRNSGSKSSAAGKSLFEPIVISVPEVVTAKKKDVGNQANKITPAEPSSAQNTGSAAQNAADADLKPDESRPRLVAQKTGQDIVPCKLTASQDKISVLAGGGSLSILVGFKDSGNAREITATSSSPKDVEVTFEPQIGADMSRAFFVIKSVSQSKGVYTVEFESFCGRKEITVKVR